MASMHALSTLFLNFENYSKSNFCTVKIAEYLLMVHYTKTVQVVVAYVHFPELDYDKGFVSVCYPRFETDCPCQFL